MMRAWINLTVVLVSTVCLVGRTEALDPAAAEEYGACTAEIATAPERARDRAIAWSDTGGGDASRHCLALALSALGDHGLAAQGFAQLAATIADAPDEVRATLFGQAGNAWLLADKADEAAKAFDDGLAVAPDNVELLIDRARAHADQEDYGAAVADLDAAIARDPTRDQAHVFRAAAHRHQEAFDLAAADLVAALAINPINPDALLERAMLHLAQDASLAARGDLESVLIVAPDSDAGALARAFIVALDPEQASAAE